MNYDQYLLNYRDKANTSTRHVDAASTTTASIRLLLAETDVNRGGTYAARVAALAGTIYPFYLHDGLQYACLSAEEWFATRQRFRSTLSATSMASYLLGIGDRHLENFLVDRGTGELVAIDFGFAFGAATTTLPIPELVPFRLTPQMAHAVGPTGVASLLFSMERALWAIREQRGILQCIASAFLHEPLLEWSSGKKKAGVGQETGAARTGDGWREGSDVAEVKLATLYRKLNLEHPVAILDDDIDRNHKVRLLRVGEFVKRAARGDPVAHRAPPSEQPQGSSTPATLDEKTFVATLLDLATDWNVLGRTWGGWAPLF